MLRDAEQLRKISSFKALLTFLEEKMHWPIGRFEFDEVTFEYDPHKLGLKDTELAKIKSIHQLRPLKTHQPWNIFFIEFETKKVPVAVLRRILGRLVADKKKTKKHDAIWNTEDLLFISSTGATDKEIAFAHFHQDEKDKPTLRVLGWDGGDTLLKLDDLAQTMKDKLRWPDDEGDIDAWRKTWASAFKHKPGETIRTAAELADALAGLAKRIKSAALVILQSESEEGPLRELHKMVQRALVHDQNEVDFADTFAQTITYGLLTAAIANQQKEEEGKFKDELVAEHVSELVPMTNPLLKELLGTFLEVGGRKAEMDFDELGVQEVVELLRSDDVDLKAIVHDFGKKTQSEDPIIHFYESFLKAYSKKTKIDRGVFYTPQPVVSYIVRSVHEILQKEFGLEEGLASTITWKEMVKKNMGLKIPKGTDPDSHFVVILDPATGTGTFLIETLDVIYGTLKSIWKKAGKSERDVDKLWNEYVPKHLLPRLFGYEIMMAPYAIAHMRLGLKLHETGYRFEGTGRAQIYLTNALEPATEANQMTLEGMGDALAHESATVNEIKQKQRFTVIVGNPPYSKMTGNRSSAAIKLVEPFRFVDGQKFVIKAALAHELNLQDDYVKFYGLLYSHIQASNVGVASYISNFGYLSTPSLQGLRWCLMQVSSFLSILNLGGRVADRKGGDEEDENVFEIGQGVAISTVVRSANPKQIKSFYYGRMFGKREEKYKELMNSTPYTATVSTPSPRAPFFRFGPIDQNEDEYRQWRSVDEIFVANSGGIITSRDALAINLDEEKLLSNITRFSKSTNGDKTLLDELGFSIKAKWDVEECKNLLRQKGVSKKDVQRLLYRPFDERYIYYFPPLLDTPSRPISEIIYEGKNLVLLSPRVKTSPLFCHVLVSRVPAEKKSCSHDEATQMFPIFRYTGLNAKKKILNIDPAVKTELTTMYDLADDVNVIGGFLAGYIYSILNSPKYRDRYGEALKDSFPRIPFTNITKLAHEISVLGRELISLHLMESSKLDEPVAEFIGVRSPVVEKVSWSNNTVWIDKAQTIGFKGVSEAVWNFHIGGYQVCDKWLKDRKGRKLLKADIEHYQKVVVVLSETIRIMKEIDEVIEKHGGWPGAFQTN